MCHPALLMVSTPSSKPCFIAWKHTYILRNLLLPFAKASSDIFITTSESRLLSRNSCAYTSNLL
uniref:Putative ovule protein n=1 Tax=Solanum chacoense TaxID=4108 RepID=A0A0V0GV36_SOLCH